MADAGSQGQVRRCCQAGRGRGSPDRDLSRGGRCGGPVDRRVSSARGETAVLCRASARRTQIGRRDGRSHQPALSRHGTGHRSVSFLLDTNVVSETRRKAPDQRVVAWVSQADPSDLFISAMTLGEIAKGVALRAKQSPAQAAGLEQWLAETRTE